MPADVPPARVRRAVEDDVDVLVDLRALMFAAMGEPVDGTAWRGAAASWLRAEIATPGLAAFVVEDPAAGVVSAAAGTVDRHAPSPHNPTGRVGELFNVATFPAYRRRGHARRAVTAVLGWFDTEADVAVVRLHATDDGAELYRSLGFVDPTWTPMRRVRPGSAPA